MNVITFLLTVGVVSANPSIPWWNIKAAQEQGPNVCVVEQVPGTNRNYYTECKYWRPRTICGNETIIKYECCEGYEMVPGQLGCTGVSPLTDVVETARNAGAGKFADFLEKTGVATELKQGLTVTLFAPSDEAFDAYVKTYGAIKPEKITSEKYRKLAMHHFVDRKLLSDQWGADKLIDSKLSRHKIRINKYSNGMETVNCELIMRKNQQATNGVVHIIDGVLIPDRYKNMGIVEAIIADGRFNVLAKALNNTNSIVERIKNSDVPHTFFAPSDEAFQKIPWSRWRKILEDKDTLEAFLANHVISHVVCLSGVISEHHAKTLGPQRLTLDCTSRGRSLEGQRLRQDFLHGLDGLVYLIDDVLLPDRAKTVTELAKDEKLGTFMQVVKNAGLEDAFENFDSYTLLAPSEAAIYSIPDAELKHMETDREKAKEFVLNHAVFGKHTTDSIYDNQVVMSLDEKTPLRFQVYRGSVGIEDAVIEKADKQGSNGVLHVINKVLRTNNNSLDDVLKTNGNFSIWLQAMDKLLEIQPAEFQEFIRPSESTVAYTYFVPSDRAFKQLDQAKLDRLMNDSTYLTKTLKNHVVNNMMVSGGFQRDLRYAVKTEQSTVDIVKKNDTIMVNDARIIRCDMLSRNGVAHEINKVLLPENSPHPRRYLRRNRGSRRADRTRLLSSRSDTLRSRDIITNEQQ
ncbi:transforming growth factor-beta-induced protein ig-h3 isoform X2 [Neodiprion lecontei]|uniref:Transforming growth factor-beta-induced protein ig-h3 isoform X2 n=1 Tax=Neodiprion lecontei TaxID=441921 RepID=A0ABM3G6R9_NEOLC|nr:transforming growth factor-beta-induced protein ig-h3 isoform X2 [Neodiprion lecontei]